MLTIEDRSKEFVTRQLYDKTIDSLNEAQFMKAHSRECPHPLLDSY